MSRSSAALNLIWALLCGLTLLAWWLGEHESAGRWTVAALMALAGFKGLLVIRDFMALRRVRQPWPLLVGGWLFLVLLVNLSLYW
ncbi:MAG: cytochrome C oxidase subunit IV family protein, partial [Zoogloea sp.]|uniref:cytochrome C oxidase subunit IV family protein n=1 Tax=Zoogloea sp. TaxID=49181 RepID=UPI003F345E08